MRYINLVILFATLVLVPYALDAVIVENGTKKTITLYKFKQLEGAEEGNLISVYVSPGKNFKGNEIVGLSIAMGKLKWHPGFEEVKCFEYPNLTDTTIIFFNKDKTVIK